MTRTHQIEVVCWLIHKYLIGVNVVLGYEVPPSWSKCGWGRLYKQFFLELSEKSLLPFDVLLTTYDIALVDQDFLSQVP
ncbi:hypothetical protein HID58_017807, partial [Brassica napus]